MRNRALHDALRDFALEAAALLSDDLKAGAEVEFDVVDEGDRRGPVLYRYQPRTGAFIGGRWERLRELPACHRACLELGAGAASWLRVNGLRGEQAEPALQAMLERLYEDATSFGFPEERFERVYREVETTLFRDAVRDRVVAPLDGAWMEAERIDFGGGLSIVRGDHADAPAEAVYPEGGDGAPALLCALDSDMAADERLGAGDADARMRRLVTALRLWRAGAVSLGAPGWRRTDHGRWSAVPVGGTGAGRGPGWQLAAGEEGALREFVAVIEGTRPGGTVAWALARFEMACERPRDSEALSDLLLALRGLLDATGEAGQASLALRVAALCAEEGRRREVQGHIESAISLERMLMGGGGRVPDGSPREVVAQLEDHVRALLRDILCGYLDSDLKTVADEILIESNEEPFPEIHARDMRGERFTRESEPAPEPEPEPEPERESEPEPEPRPPPTSRSPATSRSPSTSRSRRPSPPPWRRRSSSRRRRSTRRRWSGSRRTRRTSRTSRESRPRTTGPTTTRRTTARLSEPARVGRRRRDGPGRGTSRRPGSRDAGGRARAASA